MKHININSYHVTENYVVCEFDHDGAAKIFHITLKTFVELLNEVGEIQIGQFLSDDTKVELFGEISGSYPYYEPEQIKTTPFVFDVCNSYISINALEKIIDKLLDETPVCFISNMTDAIAFLVNDVKKEVAKTVTEKINEFISTEGKGDMRDALNVALWRLEVAQNEIIRLNRELQDKEDAEIISLVINRKL